MSKLINGRTPEEIKKTLDMCGYGMCDVQTCPHATRTDCSVCAMRDALALIQHLEDQQSKWISVKERLPERYTPVLILVKRMPDNPNSSYICLVGVYDGDYWMKDSGHYYDDIDGEAVCWMPLPEPPKGEDK